MGILRCVFMIVLIVGSTHGWQIESVAVQGLGAHGMSATGIFDIDGDSVPELLVPGNSRLYCFDHTGGLRWSFAPMSNYFPAVSSPLAADLDNDGDIEIVVSSPAAVYVLNQDGDSIWRRLLAGQGAVQNCISSVALADINGDLLLEILCYEVYANRLLCLNPVDGDTIWTYVPGGSPMFSVGTPTAVDIDLDGRVEVIGQVAWNGGGGQLYCLGDSGRELWHFDTPGSGISGWQLGSAMVADVNGDDSLEVITTANYWGAVCLTSRGRQLWRRAISEHAASYGAVADIDRDETLEVVLALGPSVRCFSAPTGRDKWSFTVAPGYYIVASPGVADLDGDGRLEVLFAEVKQNNPVDTARPAWVLSCYGQPLWSDTIGTTMADPTTGDVDGDGRLELFFGPTMRRGNWYWYEVDTAVAAGRVDWPTLQHDIWRSGWYEYHGPQVGVGEERVVLGRQLGIGPNPLNDRLNTPITGEEVEIYDAAGRRVMVVRATGLVGLDRRKLMAGVYFWRCRHNSYPAMKVVKAR